MSMKDNLKSGLSDMKSRTLLFVMLIAASFLGIIVFFAYSKATQPEVLSQASRSRVVNPAANIKSIPGVSQTDSKEYKKLQAQKTKEQAEKAYLSGGSDVSPILSTGNMIKSLPENRVASLLDKPDNSYEKLQEQLKAQQKAQEEALAKQQQKQNDILEAQQQALRRQQYRQDLAQQIEALKRAGFSPNSSPATSQHVVYAEKPKKQEKKTKDRATSAETKPPKIIYKAGTMLQGVLLSSINSDTPAPIVAQVVNGALKGARLVGSIDEKSIPKTSLALKVSKALVLNFNIISIPQLPNSLKVKAVAINPNTASTSIATDVDNHYLLRYGTFLGATFLSGLSQAIQQSGQQIVAIPNTNNGDNQNQLAVDQPKTSKSQQIQIAVGNAMQQLVGQVNYLGTPPTIKIDSGTAVGLLLLEDLTEQTPSNTVVQKVSSTTTVSQEVPKQQNQQQPQILSGATQNATGTNQTIASNSSSNAASDSTSRQPATRFVNDTFAEQLNRLNTLVGE